MRTTPHIAEFCRILFILLAAATLLAAGAGQPQAGDLRIHWDPVEDEDLAGYRLYYGDQSRAYDQVIELGPTETGHTIADLADCRSWHVALTSVDREGLESVYSTELSGYPQPRITRLSPDVLLAGAAGEILVEGAAFEPGLVVISTGLQVESLRRESCERLLVRFRAPVGAGPGSVDLQVLNPGQVPAVAPISLSLVTEPGPGIISVQPRDGTLDVALMTAPVLEFNRDLLPASVTGGSVRLLDEGGAPVPQSAGSPEVSGRTVIIRPAAELVQARAYRVQVMGGTTGVLDLAGAPMVAHFLQAGGFRIIDLPPGEVPGVRRKDIVPPS